MIQIKQTDTKELSATMYFRKQSLFSWFKPRLHVFVWKMSWKCLLVMMNKTVSKIVSRLYLCLWSGRAIKRARALCLATGLFTIATNSMFLENVKADGSILSCRFIVSLSLKNWSYVACVVKTTFGELCEATLTIQQHCQCKVKFDKSQRYGVS